MDPAPRPSPAHVVLLDGTLSTLERGWETSIGLTFRMLAAHAATRVYYEPGIQWRGWRAAPEVAAGVGVNRQIRRAYAHLAANWRPGDRIFLMGYSRGAYAVRALAGMIDRMGLLRAEQLDSRRVRVAYHHYRTAPTSERARRFRARHCHDDVVIDAVGVFDTVQAVGIRWPVLWRVVPEVHAFRSNRLGQSVRHGFHALAANETRRAFAPEVWRTHGARTATVEQVWFRGSHADVGGQVGVRPAARPLANVPLTWMLGRMQEAGLPLPNGWRDAFPADPDAPSVGTWRGFGPLFVSRRRRAMGVDASERIHPSLAFRPRRLRRPRMGDRKDA